MGFAFYVKEGKNLFILRPPNGTESIFWVFFIETLYTFILITVVLHLKYSKYAPS